MVESVREFQELALKRVRQTYKPTMPGRAYTEVVWWNHAVASIETWLVGQMEDAHDYPLMGDASYQWMPLDTAFLYTLEEEIETNVE